jgi:hypothetical protein
MSPPQSPALSPGDVERLAKILGRLGSDFDGERAAAGALAARFLKQRHLTWAELLEPAAPVPAAPICPRCRRPSPEFGWRRLADLCLQIGQEFDLLSEWEAGFLGSLRCRGYPPTAKQAAVLRRIATSLGVA